MSQMTTEKTRNGKTLKLSFVDIRKAYFNGIPKRRIYLMLPKELGLQKGTLGFLVKCAYGTRDAGAIWEDTYAGALMSMGFRRGDASPCCFVHDEKGISLVVHGDDFTALGVDESLNWYETELAKHFELKLRGRLGNDKGDVQEMRILNRIIRLDESGIRYEADPRQTEILIKSLGLTGSKPVISPGVKNHDEEPGTGDDPQEEETVNLTPLPRPSMR